MPIVFELFLVGTGFLVGVGNVVWICWAGGKDPVADFWPREIVLCGFSPADARSYWTVFFSATRLL